MSGRPPGRSPQAHTHPSVIENMKKQRRPQERHPHSAASEPHAVRLTDSCARQLQVGLIPG